MIAIVALLVGALVFAATLVVLTSSRRGAIRRRVSPYGGPAPRPRHAGRRPSGADLTRRIESLLAGAGLDRRLRLTLDRAGVDLRAGAAAGLVLTVSAAVFLLLLLAANAAVAVVAALAVPALAALVLAARSTRRSRAFELQLPEILDTLAASLRTGQSFDTALQAMTEDIGEPARSEFLRVITEVNLGRPLETALAELGERVRSEDLQFVLDAIMVQRQVGGSLAELFVLVSETVRSREQFRRKLRAVTGMARMSARVLTAMPIVAILALSAVSWSYMAPLLTTSLGHILLLATAAMVTVGGLLLKKIGDVRP